MSAVFFLLSFPPDIVQRLSTSCGLSLSSPWSVLIIPRLRATHRLSSSSSSSVYVFCIELKGRTRGLLTQLDDGVVEKKSRLETTTPPTRRSKTRARLLCRCFAFSRARFRVEEREGAKWCEAQRARDNGALFNCRPEPIG